MDRKIKIKILNAVSEGLPLETAMKAHEYKVLFAKQDFYTTALDGGEKISKQEGGLLIKHFPSIFVSKITGISFDPE